MAWRFCVGHLVIIDATFNINNKKMPLLTAVRVNNKQETFPIALAYIPSESAEAFQFFFSCMCKKLFYNVLKPTVYLLDIAAGIIKAVDILNSIPNS